MSSIFSLVLTLIVTFQHDAGPYTLSDWKLDWLIPPFQLEAGRPTQRSRIENKNGNAVLAILYPAGAIGANSTAWWNTKFPGQQCAQLSYRFQFDEKFDFVKGGKLPGLGGGTHNTGGERPDGFDGFSIRPMWRGDGRMVNYVYHTHQPDNFGEDFPWKIGQQDVHILPGFWYEIRTKIQLNTVGRSDGMLETYLNGRRVFLAQNFEFRKTEALTIDSFLFHTFFGGSTPDWAPSQEEKAYFDDFRIGKC